MTAMFVSVDWLHEHYAEESLQVLDARMLPLGQEAVRDIQAEYLAGHLPDAPFFNIEALSDHTSPYPHMMLRPETFAVAMRELGVSQDRHLIVYDEGNLFSAPRAWWMLRAFGCEQVSILVGGLQGWKAAGFAPASGPVSLPEGQFDARYDSSQVKRLTDVLLISHEGGAQIVDARAANRFNAEVDEPRPDLQRGHIPHSLNIPWNNLVENGALKPEAELRALFAQAGIKLDQPIVLPAAVPA